MVPAKLQRYRWGADISPFTTVWVWGNVTHSPQWRLSPGMGLVVGIEPKAQLPFGRLSIACSSKVHPCVSSCPMHRNKLTPNSIARIIKRRPFIKGLVKGIDEVEYIVTGHDPALRPFAKSRPLRQARGSALPFRNGASGFYS